MNLDFDLESRLAALTGSQAGERPDWHGLRARLAAAYSARPLLERSAYRETAIDGGSFDRGSARSLALYGMGHGGGLGPVNPTGLANGNPGCDNNAAVTNANVAGD